MALSKIAGTSIDSNVALNGNISVTGTTPSITVGDAGAEDAKIVFDGNAQDYHIGLDDSLDSFVIGNNGFSTQCIVINDSAIVTIPNQPAVHVKPASTQSDVAVNAGVVIAFGTEVFDKNGDFASNTFTAPVTGSYQVNVTLEVENIDGNGDTYSAIDVIASNRSQRTFIDFNSIQNDSSIRSLMGSVLMDMDANDTLYVQWYQGGGSAQADISTQSSLSIFLAC